MRGRLTEIRQWMKDVSDDPFQEPPVPLEIFGMLEQQLFPKSRGRMLKRYKRTLRNAREEKLYDECDD